MKYTYFKIDTTSKSRNKMVAEVIDIQNCEA